jgi:hypothetical protein
MISTSSSIFSEKTTTKVNLFSTTITNEVVKSTSIDTTSTSTDLIKSEHLPTAEVTSLAYRSHITGSKMKFDLKLYLTHYWPICNGQMLDEIGLAHMTQGNLTSFKTDRFGAENSALALNGGWTQVPQSIYFDTPEFSISVWIYPQQADSWSRVFDFANGCHLDQIQLALVQYAGLKGPCIELFDQSTFINSAASVSIMTPLTWHFLVATFDGSSFFIYVDGNLMAQSTSSLATIAKRTAPNVTRLYNYIGKSNCKGDGFSFSLIDDLRFYNRSFDLNEINYLMSNGSTFGLGTIWCLLIGLKFFSFFLI